MAKIVYRQTPAARKLPQQPPPPAKARMQKPQSGGKFLFQISGGARGNGYGKIDSCIIGVASSDFPLFIHSCHSPVKRLFIGPDIIYNCLWPFESFDFKHGS